MSLMESLVVALGNVVLEYLDVFASRKERENIANMTLPMWKAQAG